MWIFASLFVTFACGGSAGSGVKFWTKRASWDAGADWDLGRVPCSGDRVLLPAAPATPITLGRRAAFRELLLPITGVVYFPPDGLQTDFSAEDASCPGQDIAFSDVPLGAWEDPSNWRGEGGEAVPHLERVPCRTEMAVFPPESDSYGVLNPPASVSIDHVYLDGVGPLWGESWTEYISNNDAFHFDGTREVVATGEGCTDKAGCECGMDHLRDWICDLVPSCYQYSPCFDPIMPDGFCCPICGSSISYKIDSSFDMKETKKILKEIVGDEVDWHLSRRGDLVQLVLVDKGEYSAISPKIANNINQTLFSKPGLGLSFLKLHASGYQYRPWTTENKVTQFFVTMFVAATILICLALYFYKDETLVWRSSVMNSRRMFARFENVTGEVELAAEGSVEEEDSSPVDIRSFDNPIYSSSISQDEHNIFLDKMVYSEILISDEKDNSLEESKSTD